MRLDSAYTCKVSTKYYALFSAKLLKWDASHTCFLATIELRGPFL